MTGGVFGKPAWGYISALFVASACSSWITSTPHRFRRYAFIINLVASIFDLSLRFGHCVVDLSSGEPPLRRGKLADCRIHRHIDD